MVGTRPTARLTGFKEAGKTIKKRQPALTQAAAKIETYFIYFKVY
jgi:hypothetical protein